MKYRLKLPKNQVWMPGALEFAAVVGIAAALIGRVYSLIRPSGGK